jgi:hypothetical protein
MTLTPRDRRMLQILGAVAGVAVVFLLVTKVFGGGGEDLAALPTGSSGVVVPTTSPSLSATPTPAETLPPVVLAGARDPFSPPPGLVATTATSAPVGATGTGGSTSSSTVTSSPSFTTTTSTFSPSPTTTTTTTSTSTSTSTTTTSPGPGGDDNNPPPNEITIGDHRLRLQTVDAKHDRVEILVEHKLWTVEVGATFAQTFKLVKIDGDCARFLFGDQSFTLCLKTKT